MPTLEQVQAKVRANFPNSAVASAKPLEWTRETAHSMVTTDNRYRLSRTAESGGYSYSVWTIPSDGKPPKLVAGPYITASEAKEAVQ